MGFAVHRTPKVRNCNAPVIYELLTQERVETIHRKWTKYIIIFSFGFDLGGLGQNQLWKKRLMSNFWGAGQNPTVFYCDHSKETFLEAWLIFLIFCAFTQKSLDFPQFSSLPILPRVKVSKRQAMDIQHSLLTSLLLVVRSNISKEINILLILDRRTTAKATKTSPKNWIHAASNFISLIPSRLIRQMLINFFGVEF